MFTKTRIQLTAWYLLIIMTISLAFSTFIYFGATSEFDRILRMQEYRMQHPGYRVRVVQGVPFEIDSITLPPLLDPEVVEDAKIRVLNTLIAVNSIILIFSALAGYFLAGRTLRPIQEMIDEQNRFVTDASHELNTPLTSLRTGIEVNLRNPNLTLQQSKDVLVSNLEEVTHLQALSDELIKLTQHENQNATLSIGEVTLKKIITEAVNRVKLLAEKKQITIKQMLLPGTVEGNEKSLIDLFVILLDNAIKYSAEKKTITITMKKDDGHIRVLVQDKGIGIAAKDIPHIFDRFYRADKSRTKQNADGYGLGLSIAKKIVTMHDGTIDVESTVGKRSTFTIRLPIAENRKTVEQMNS